MNETLNRKKEKYWEIFVYNIILFVALVLCGIYNVQVNMVIGIVGTVVCFGNVYVFPMLV